MTKAELVAEVERLRADNVRLTEALLAMAHATTIPVPYPVPAEHPMPLPSLRPYCGGLTGDPVPVHPITYCSAN